MRPTAAGSACFLLTIDSLFQSSVGHEADCCLAEMAGEMKNNGFQSSVGHEADCCHSPMPTLQRGRRFNPQSAMRPTAALAEMCVYVEMGGFQSSVGHEADCCACFKLVEVSF